jgi:hypothetical protein
MSISMRTVLKKLMSTGIEGRTRPSPISRRVRPSISLLEDRFCPAASIMGNKYDDLNGNGSREPDEPGIVGAVVYVDLNHNGIRDLGGTIDPENFTQGQSLTNALPGVTLQVADAAGNPTTFQVMAGTDSSSSTGSKVFTDADTPFWYPSFRFRSTFDQSVGRVNLDFISSGSGQVGRLEAYNAQGQLIASYNTASLNAGQKQTMSILRAEKDIKYVLAYSSVGTFGRLDNLNYGFYEPSAVTDANGDYRIDGLAAAEYVLREEGLPSTRRQTQPGAQPIADDAGVFFGTAYIPTTNQLTLVEIDAGSGQVTRIGNFQSPPMLGMVVTNSGQMLGMFGPNNSLYSIDRTTGQTTLIGNSGLSLAWGLTYDSNTDTLYGLGSMPNNPSEISLVTFNRATGIATPVGPGIPGLTGTSGLAFDAANNRILAFDNADKQLYSFDAITGAGSLLSVLPPNVAGWGVAYDGEYLVIGMNTGHLGYFDPTAGTLHHTKTLSEPTYLESLEYYQAEPNTYRISLDDGEVMSGLDFGSKSILGSIQGTKYNDANRNGTQDPDESGVAGVTVYADLNHNGKFDLSGVVDPDQFAPGTDLTNSVPGVTLNVLTSSGISTSVKVRVGTNPNSSSSPVFFRDSIYYWNSSSKFRAEFAQSIGRVELDFIATGSGQSGRIEAFNAQGQLIATYDTPLAQFNGQIQKMSINRAQGDIKYIVAYTAVGTFGSLDKLNFGFVEPSAVTDANGHYSINGLMPGDYVIREVIPAGQHQTDPGPSQGNDGHPGIFFGTAYIPNTNQLQLVEVDAGTGKVFRVGQIETVPMLGVVMTNDGKLYGINGPTNTLYSIDRATGATTLIGSTGMVITWGLTYDPDTDTIYTLGQTNPAQNINSLLVVNRQTGATVAVGNGISGLTGTSGLAFDRVNQRVLAYDNADKQVYSFDVMTGQGTLLSTLPQNVNSWGVAFDGQYLVLGLTSSNGLLGYFNPNTGDLIKTITPSEPLFLESFEYLTGEPFTQRISLSESEIVTGVDFGNQSSLGAIRGTKFEDYDADGVRDSNEPGIGGIPVFLDLNHNGIRDGGGTIDPDQFVEGEDMTHVIPGVTLNVTTTGTTPEPFFKIRATTDANRSTGTKVFSHENIPFFVASRKFRAEFDQPITKISLDFIGNSTLSGTIGRLEAYNAQGQLIASYNTASLLANQVETMSILRAPGDIKFILAYTTNNGFGRLDNLRYGQPEPVAATDSDGNYAFVGLPAGDYVVRETIPAGYRQTYPGEGATSPQGVYFGTAYFENTGQTQLIEVDSNGKVSRIGGLMSQRMHGLVMTKHGQLFGINNFHPTNDEFYSINRTTGAATLIGQTGFDLAWGLTYDPTSDTIYALGVVNGGNGLFKIDPSTGAATRIGTGTVLNSGISGLAFDAVQNRVLVYDNNTKAIMAFNPSTGDATTLSYLPPNTFGWGIAFDGQHVVVGNNGAGTYFELFDPDSGLKMGQLNLSERAIVESLEFIASEPFTHRVSVGLGETIEEIDFGNKGPNRGPVAQAGGPYLLTEGQGITLDASATTDVEGSSLTYGWDLDNDGEYDDATGVHPTLTWEELVAFGIADDDEYTIGLKVTDTDPDGSLSATATTTITVENAAPAIQIELDKVAVDEAGLVTLHGTITDTGTADTHEVVIDWGDGSPAFIIELEAGQRTFEVSHTYTDDNPSGSAADLYTIQVNVSDDDGGTAIVSTDILVNNVPPVITSISNSAATIGSVAEGNSVVLNAGFTDLGIADTHQATIDWGDGFIETVSLLALNGTGSLSSSHVYSSGGVYDIKVTLSDDDTSSVVASTRAFVSGAGVHNGVLQIVGTTSGDNISLNNPEGNLRVSANFLPGGLKSFVESGIRMVQVFLGNGNDNFSATGNVTLPLLVDGGAGNDNISAGKGQSILIGGSGADNIVGNKEEDILIAGTTSFEGDSLAWEGILTEWTDTSKSLTDRIANLSDGGGTPTRANGNFFLTHVTIQNDTSSDNLVGKQDRDWYFADPSLDNISMQSEDYFGEQ